MILPAVYLNQIGVRLKELLAKSSSRDEAVMALIRELVIESKNILFSGNNYSQEWRAEAKKRGLPIIDSCAEGFAVWRDESKTAFLAKTKVLSHDEIVSRYNVNIERYVKTLEIEFETGLELVREYAIPAIEGQLAQSYALLSAVKSEVLKGSLGKRVALLEDCYHQI